MTDKRPIDMAIEIIQSTHDGDDLAPEHLSLVQGAVNDWLTPEGKLAFQELYQSVKKGYVKPWFHGIENLTNDHEGYVNWKGLRVEHYNLSWAYSEEAKKSAEQLADRCRQLEAKQMPVNCTTAIWRWPESLKNGG